MTQTDNLATMRPRSVLMHPLSHVLERAAQSVGLKVLSAPQPLKVGEDVAVSGVSIDSRRVLPGDAYIALPGAKRHGAEFSAQALAQGAKALLVDPSGEEAARRALEESTSKAALFVLQPALRLWVGPVSAEIYGSNQRAFPLMAVTGTNGKTTTSYMLREIFARLGRQSGLMGTIEILAGDEPIDSVLTTPESPDVHGIIGRMRENGVDAAAMEVSSHAIDYHRVDGLLFDVSGFTNLTQDHLDLHGDMESYFASKAELMTSQRSAKSVILADDAWGQKMLEHARAHGVQAYGLSLRQDSGADFRVSNVETAGIGYRFDLHTAEDKLSILLPLPGDFNIANAALAVSMLLVSGVSLSELRPLLSEGKGLSVSVPGRMEVISREPMGIVDFAHNPDAMRRAITSVRGQGRTILVFGATGERDQSKRQMMGAIAAELADVVIVTDDDPHGEDPAPIREQLIMGARKQLEETPRNGVEIFEVYPRDVAIERAVALARPQDTILVAGRGHEKIQEVAGTDVLLDDREELTKALIRFGYLPLRARDGQEHGSQPNGESR